MIVAQNAFRRRLLWHVVATVSVIVAVGVAVLLTTTAMLAGRIMPGTFVAGVDLSGLTVTTATAQVGGAVGDAAVRSATVTFADNAYTLAAGDAAVSVDVSATIRVAYLRGRDSVGAFCSVR